MIAAVICSVFSNSGIGSLVIPKIRYPLGLLLVLPVWVAAYYRGWVNRESQVQSQYERIRKAAETYRREVFESWLRFSWSELSSWRIDLKS